MMTSTVRVTLVSVPGTNVLIRCSLDWYSAGRTIWMMSASPISRASQPAVTGTQRRWLRRSGGLAADWPAAGGLVGLAVSPPFAGFAAVFAIWVTP